MRPAKQEILRSLCYKRRTDLQSFGRYLHTKNAILNIHIHEGFLVHHQFAPRVYRKPV